MGSEKTALALKVLGILFMIGTFIFLIISLFYFTIGLEEYSDEENQEGGYVLTTCCVLPGLILGIIFLGRAYYITGKNKPMQDLANLLRGYRVIPISEVANRIKKSDYETEHLILTCITNGYVKGYINPKTREFVLDPAVSGPVYYPPPMPKPQPQPQPQMQMRPPPPAPLKLPVPDMKNDECPSCGGLLFYSRKRNEWYCPICE
jgi:hypothetical protein